MEFFIIWILFGIGCAIAAGRKNRSGFGWFLLGALFGPFGLLFILLLPKIEEAVPAAAAPASSPSMDASSLDAETKKCPACAELIKFEAIKCRYCGHEFDRGDVARQVDERRATLTVAAIDAAAREGKTQCPACKRWDVHQAITETGGWGYWCPHCKKSLESLARA